MRKRFLFIVYLSFFSSILAFPITSSAKVIEIETKPILVTSKPKKPATIENSSSSFRHLSSENSTIQSDSNSVVSPDSKGKLLSFSETDWKQISYAAPLLPGSRTWKDSQEESSNISEKLKQTTIPSETAPAVDAIVSSSSSSVSSSVTPSPEIEQEPEMKIEPRMNERDQQERFFIGNDSDLRIINGAQPSSTNRSISGGQIVSPDRSWSIRKERALEFGTEISRISYKEPIFDLEEKGWMYGLYGSYQYRPAPGSYLYNKFLSLYRLDLKGSYGQVDYESVSGTIDDIDDYMVEVRGLLGKDFYLGKQILLTPYSGLGWRYLNDDSGGRQVQSGAYGYERESRYFYAPLGGEVSLMLGHKWMLGMTGEYDFFILGQQTSHLSDVPGGYPDLKNKQRDGYGARGSVKISRIGDSINFLVEPYIRYWHIDDSDVNTAIGSGFIVTGLEPENNSTEIGVKLGVEY